MQIALMLILSLVATVIASFLGALLALGSLKLPKIALDLMQNFAVGGIFALVFIEIFPEAVENFLPTTSDDTFLATLYTVLIALAAGITFFVIHELTHGLAHHHKEDKDDSQVCEDHGHTVDIYSHHESVLAASFIFLLAIAVHNIPEGLSLGVLFTDLNENQIPMSGIIMTAILFIHNLMIGFTMGTSFLNAKKSKPFSALMTTLSSVPAYIFALVGFFLNYEMNPLVNSIIFSISAGSLLYVLFIELLPQTFYEYKNRFTFIFLLLGILLGGLLLAI